MKNLKALESESTIVLKYGKNVVNIQKKSQSKLFKKVSKLIKAGDVDTLVEIFNEKSKAIEDYAGEHFSIKDGLLIMKDGGEIVPKAVAKKLIEMKDAGEDYAAVLNFWKRLRTNPSESSREELYRFMVHNNIPLTPSGHIIVEKGVKEMDGELVDCHTGRISNAIGGVVYMDREKVDAVRENTCSRGLHVAPPDYVRKWYGNDIIVECLVDPQDVVSVPVDYNNQKMRVCKYTVLGFAPKNRKKVALKSLADYADNMTFKEKKKVQHDKIGDYPVMTENMSREEFLSKMTAKEIVAYIEKETGEVLVDINDKNKLKNKKGLIKKAIKALENYTPQTVDFTGMKCKDIIESVETDLGVKLGGKNPRRGKVLKKAIILYKEKGINVIDS